MFFNRHIATVTVLATTLLAVAAPVPSHLNLREDLADTVSPSTNSAGESIALISSEGTPVFAHLDFSEESADTLLSTDSPIAPPHHSLSARAKSNDDDVDIYDREFFHQHTNFGQLIITSSGQLTSKTTKFTDIETTYYVLRWEDFYRDWRENWVQTLCTVIFLDYFVLPFFVAALTFTIRRRAPGWPASLCVVNLPWDYPVGAFICYWIYWSVYLIIAPFFPLYLVFVGFNELWKIIMAAWNRHVSKASEVEEVELTHQEGSWYKVKGHGSVSLV